MRSVNPIFIPRNHKVEEALKEASENKLNLLSKLIDILKNPYETKQEYAEYQMPMPTNNGKYKTFCGT